MAYSDLEKIEKLVHHLWDAVALTCLENAALRYTELHREMKAWSGRRLTDTELTRTRHRLVSSGMISLERSRKGHNVYSITEAGRIRLYQIRQLAQIAPRLEPQDDKQQDKQDDDHPGDRS